MCVLVACHGPDQIYEFTGEYEAPLAKYRLRMVASGNFKGRQDISEEAFSLVRVCPSTAGIGRPFDLTLVAYSVGSVRAESRELGVALSEWSWNTAEGVFKDMLDRAGFLNVPVEEIKGSVHVIGGSLLGPKGTVLKGQIDSLKVLYTKSKYVAMTRSGRPDTSWIGRMSLQSCDGLGSAPNQRRNPP